MIEPLSPPPLEDTQVTVLPKYLQVADWTQLLLAASLLSYLLFFDLPVNLLIKLILTAAVVWIMAGGWTWVVLASVLVNVLLREPPNFSAGIGWGEVLYTCVCLGLVIYVAGYRTLRRELRYWLALGWQELLPTKAPGDTAGLAGDQPVPRADARVRVALYWQSTWPIAQRALGLLLVVLISTLAFVQLPILEPSKSLWWERSVELNFNLWPGPTAFLIAVACLVMSNVFAWRGLTRQEAGIYLRTTAMTYYFRDIRSILGRLKKLKRLHK